MLKRSFHLVRIVLVSVLVLGLSGCPFKKKRPPVPQPSAQAPTTTSPSEPAPQPAPPAAEPAKEEPKPEEVVVKPKPKPKPKQTQSAHKPATPPPAAKTEEKPQQQASAKPPKIVIQEGGSSGSSGQISTSIAHDDATHRRLTTAQLLESTETNLRNLNRSLTADEQATVAQIKDYMEQSRAATAQQDVVRAHNLALKAHLLSDEMVKQ